MNDEIRKLLLDASVALTTARQQCRCWDKMSGSCRTCQERLDIENRITEALK